MLTGSILSRLNSDMNMTEDPRWKSSRAGARAGRGFRFQDASGAFLLAEQWATGQSARLVPEGLDDLSLFAASIETRIQAKSRHDPKATFTTAEVAQYLLKSARTLTAQEWTNGQIRLTVFLERPVQDLPALSWARPLASYEYVVPLRESLAGEVTGTEIFTIDQLLERSFLVVESSPLDRAVDLFHARQDVPAFAGRIAAHELRYRVGVSADDNYLRPSTAPSSVDTTDVVATLERVQLATHEGGLQRAVQDGLCEVVNFSIAIQEPAFYSGVDVVPGHVAAGLVFDRPQVNTEIDAAFGGRNTVLIAGPSGSGKSASAWLYAHARRHEVIWYRVRRLAEGDEHLLLRLAAANEASADRPIGFVLDDVGRNYSGTWDALARETKQKPGVILLGTIREEDLDLVADLRVAATVRPRLDEELAQRLFAELARPEPAPFHHWREPFEHSNGLLLEFTHLVSQGKRLEAVLRDQVRQRLAEHRDDELLILQAVSFASRFGATLNVERLRERTRLTTPSFARAMNRLVEEHAVQWIGEHRIGGLHEIRSRHLDTLVRETLRADEAQSLKLCSAAIDYADLARFVLQALRELPSLKPFLVDTLADLLAESPIAAWTSAFHGLGLATCDLVACNWMDIWKQTEIEERFASFIFGFVLANSDLKGFEGWDKIREAARRFSETQATDLRVQLGARLAQATPTGTWTLQETFEFAAALLPLNGTSARPPVPAWLADMAIPDAPAAKLLALVSVLGECDSQAAAQLMQAHGGAQVLLDRLHAETPWLTKPTVVQKEGEQVIRANFRLINDDVVDGHEALHERNLALCELLLAAVPEAHAAGVDAVLPDGQPMTLGELTFGQVWLARKYLVTPARVSWTRAQLRAVQQLCEVDSQTARANSLAIAMQEVITQLEQVAECFCRLEAVPAGLRGRASIRRFLTGLVRSGRVDGFTKGPLDRGSYDTLDDVTELVRDIEGLMQELLDKVERPLLSASQAAKLVTKVKQAKASGLWNYTDLAQNIAFDKAALLLQSIAHVLADTDVWPSKSRASRADLAKRSRKHSALSAANDMALRRASQAVEERRAQLQVQFRSVRNGSIVISRMDPYDTLWPAASFAALVPCDSLVDFIKFLAEYLVAHGWEGSDDRMAVPLLHGMLVDKHAVGGMSLPLPRQGIAPEWRALLPFPILEEVAGPAFLSTLNACFTVSSIVTAMDRPLNEAETAALVAALDKLDQRFRAFTALNPGDDAMIEMASQKLAEFVGQVLREVEDPGRGSSYSLDYLPYLRGQLEGIGQDIFVICSLLCDWDAARQP